MINAKPAQQALRDVLPAVDADTFERAIRDGVRDAVRGYLDGLLTEPMTLSKAASLFGVKRDTLRKLLPDLGCRRVGTLYRFPISQMPPEYLRQRGLAITDQN